MAYTPLRYVTALLQVRLMLSGGKECKTKNRIAFKWFLFALHPTYTKHIRRFLHDLYSMNARGKRVIKLAKRYSDIEVT